MILGDSGVSIHCFFLVRRRQQDVELCWDALKDETSLQEVLADSVSGLAVWHQCCSGKK